MLRACTGQKLVHTLETNAPVDARLDERPFSKRLPFDRANSLLYVR